jgi:hypothetical protein
MSKAARNRQQAARARIAEQQAAARRAEARRRLLIAGGSVLAVLAVVVAFVVIKASSGTPSTPASAGGRTTVPAVASQVTSVPANTLAQVGRGSLPKSPLIVLNSPPLTSGGKPQVFYFGAEYCPFCATERWPMVVALSRFGTFNGLRFIHSSPTEQPPINSLPTLTFYQSGYSSKYLTFTPVESQTVARTALETPTAQQQALVTKYDSPPYVQAAAAQTIPFVDFGGKYLINGASYDAALLHGKTWQQVASALHDPSSPIAKGALGTANYLTAAICKVTGNQPANVCASPAITALQGQL